MGDLSEEMKMQCHRVAQKAADFIKDQIIEMYKKPIEPNPTRDSDNA